MKTEPENAMSSDHPHGKPDPRWITDDGRCLLCADSYHKSEIKRLELALKETHDCLLAREKSLKAEGEAWAKAMTQRDAWKANAEDFAIRVAEFVNDWSKGDFALPTLAAHDAEALKRPLETFAKLAASAESANISSKP